MVLTQVKVFKLFFAELQIGSPEHGVKMPAKIFRRVKGTSKDPMPFTLKTVDAIFSGKTLATSNLTEANNKSMLDPKKLAAIKGMFL